MWSDLIGRRVVVRRRVDTPGQRQHFSDVLGVLVATEPELGVQRADGQVVTIAPGQVHRIKPVPPRPPVRVEPATVDPLALAEIAAAGWPAPATERLGRWLLRAADGWTHRANSVQVLGPSGRPLAEALDVVERWYGGQGLSPAFALTLPGTERLDASLAESGWRAVRATDVLIAPVGAILATGAPAPPPVRLAPTPSPEWLATYRADPLPPVATDVLAGARLPVFASIDDGGATVAVARAVVDFDWLGISCLQVAPAARRRGLAGSVMRTLAAWGRANGARHCYVQVEQDNAPALALYDEFGFTVHHHYHYRVRA